MKTQWICGSVLLVAMAFLVACGVQKAVVTITNKPTNVTAGTSIVLNATVKNLHHKETILGVTWSMTGAGTLTNPTTNSVQYNAPPTVPSNSSVTVSATSVFDATASDSATFAITP
jgi:hypothetical protein